MTDRRTEKLVEWNGGHSVCGRFRRQTERGRHEPTFHSLLWSRDGKPPFKGGDISDAIHDMPGGDGTIRGVKQAAEWLARRWTTEDSAAPAPPPYRAPPMTTPDTAKPTTTTDERHGTLIGGKPYVCDGSEHTSAHDDGHWYKPATPAEVAELFGPDGRPLDWVSPPSPASPPPQGGREPDDVIDVERLLLGFWRMDVDARKQSLYDCGIVPSVPVREPPQTMVSTIIRQAGPTAQAKLWGVAYEGKPATDLPAPSAPPDPREPAAASSAADAVLAGIAADVETGRPLTDAGARILLSLARSYRANSAAAQAERDAAVREAQGLRERVGKVAMSLEAVVTLFEHRDVDREQAERLTFIRKTAAHIRTALAPATAGTEGRPPADADGGR